MALGTRKSIAVLQAEAAGESEVDWRPFQLVADAFLVGERRTVEAHQV